MSVGKEYYEQTVSRYEGNAHKKIAGWIVMLASGVTLFIGGIVMMVLGIVNEIVALIVLGPISSYVIGLPLAIIGTVFLVLNTVKRGVARGKIKRAKRELDNIEKSEAK